MKPENRGLRLPATACAALLLLLAASPPALGLMRPGAGLPVNVTVEALGPAAAWLGDPYNVVWSIVNRNAHPVLVGVVYEPDPNAAACTVHSAPEGWLSHGDEQLFLLQAQGVSLGDPVQGAEESSLEPFDAFPDWELALGVRVHTPAPGAQAVSTKCIQKISVQVYTVQGLLAGVIPSPLETLLKVPPAGVGLLNMGTMDGRGGPIEHDTMTWSGPVFPNGYTVLTATQSAIVVAYGVMKWRDGNDVGDFGWYNLQRGGQCLQTMAAHESVPDEAAGDAVPTGVELPAKIPVGALVDVATLAVGTHAYKYEAFYIEHKEGSSPGDVSCADWDGDVEDKDSHEVTVTVKHVDPADLHVMIAVRAALPFVDVGAAARGLALQGQATYLDALRAGGYALVPLDEPGTFAYVDPASAEQWGLTP